MATPAPSDPTAPITPARFAAALKDLSIASLHLKVLELRNALLHLAHSNEQLRPFADGTETTLNLAPGTPDPDCVDAIRENEGVMARMRERIALVRAEVEGRGVSWREFEDAGDVDEADEPGVRNNNLGAVREEGSRPLTSGVRADGDERDATSTAPAANGTNGANPTSSSFSSSTTGNPWTDGTFQMGTIRNGELHMDTAPPQRPNGVGANVNSNHNNTATSNTAEARAPQAGRGGGGRLTDEELRRLLEVRLAEDAGGDEEEEGLHL